jgi:L-lysine exporter family protein LysE/ArgO
VLTTALTGFAAGLTLIVAIGSQNAFVLRCGLARHHVGPVVLVCALSDAVLISAGVAGIGTIVTRAPVVLDVVRWAGVVFLAAYALLSFRRAWQGGEKLSALRPSPRVAGARRADRRDDAADRGEAGAGVRPAPVAKRSSGAPLNLTARGRSLSVGP